MAPSAPLGAILAGGAARRMGGAKATALLGGRPLLTWAIEALTAAGLPEVVVVAKRETPLPDHPGAEVWLEPDGPQHPLTGVRHVLEHAERRDVLTLPVDLPLVPAGVLRALATQAPGALAVVARAEGRLHPLVGRFSASATARLPENGRVTDAVLALDPVIVDVPADGFANVNTPADLEAAERAALRRRAG